MLLTLFAWCTSGAVLENYARIEELLGKLDQTQWNWLDAEIRRCRSSARVAPANDLDLKRLPQQMHIRMACLLAHRSDSETRQAIYQTYIQKHWEEEPAAMILAYEHALDADRIGRSKWSPKLDTLRKCHQMGHVWGDPGRAIDPRRVPIGLAREIAADPMQYPTFLVRLAQDRCRLQIAAKAVPLADIARRDRWFDR
jgi:hypothetical protein